MLDDRTERECLPEPDEEAEDGLEVAPGKPWQDIIRGIAGASKPRNLMPAEVAAVREWTATLEAELAETPGAADLAVLSSLGRIALLELSLSRNVFEKGGVLREGGEVKETLVELRQLIRLKADLLGRLDFRRDPKNVPGIRETWA